MSHKFTVQLEIVPENAEGPTEWFPAIPQDAALALLDDAIRRSRGHLDHLEKMRAFVAKALPPGWVPREVVDREELLRRYPVVTEATSKDPSDG